MDEVQKKKRMPAALGMLVLAGGLLAGAAFVFRTKTPKGYQDYTVQKNQYYIQYSEQYDYWDVLTVEYPVLSGIDEGQAEAVNELLYNTAMEKVNYWHLFPNDEVKELQKEYQIFCSDVHCEVPYHSQYLLSVSFEELYAPVSPVYYIHKTQRCANINLMTGEPYPLSEVFRIDADFMELWCARVEESGAYEDLIINDADTRETFLLWFLGGDAEAEKEFSFEPFFYVDESRDFVIGLSYDPKSIRKVANPEFIETSFSAHFTSEELMSYRTDSKFWDLYAASEATGEVLDCENLQENLWLGKDASVWEFMER
ncbi:MAG: hypothetical protein K2L86_10690 [Lachnospiraceae bacterium]|nr:hypothetical protein [Lachnospiraceae bacterium]